MAPEERRTTVFRRGTEKAVSDWIPAGGHADPNSIFGDNAQCRYDQKNPRKKKISETIKRPIPKRRPDCTRNV